MCVVVGPAADHAANESSTGWFYPGTSDTLYNVTCVYLLSPPLWRVECFSSSVISLYSGFQGPPPPVTQSVSLP